VPALLDRSRLDLVVQAVADRLDGDWLLVGGALVALWLEPRRMTEDVDLVSMDEPDGRLALLGLAQDLGLPVEAMNSAADFFVRGIDGWRDDVVLFRTGVRGRVFRPTPTLFILLKMRRLSGQDLADCLAALEHARAERLDVDVARLAAALRGLPGGTDTALGLRRETLSAALATD
jgi:hypothetical protein